MSTRTQVDWGGTMRRMSQQVGRGKQGLRRGVEREMTQAAADAQQFAQREHPWTNRTGDAERLFRVTSSNAGQRLTIAHGVFYGVYLEGKHGGAYGVIPAVMQYLSQRVPEGLQRAVDQAWQ